MKDLLVRLAYKLTGHKAMFTVAVLVILCAVPLTETNAGVLTNLVYAVLGAKAVEYSAKAMTAIRKQ